MAANPTAQMLKPRVGLKADSKLRLAHTDTAASSSKSLETSPEVESAAPAASIEADGDDAVADARHRAIARAAYFLAEARSFAPGCELEDWLAAERQIP